MTVELEEKHNYLDGREDYKSGISSIDFSRTELRAASRALGRVGYSDEEYQLPDTGTQTSGNMPEINEFREIQEWVSEIRGVK